MRPQDRREGFQLEKKSATLPIVTGISFRGGCQVASQQLPVTQTEGELRPRTQGQPLPAPGAVWFQLRSSFPVGLNTPIPKEHEGERGQQLTSGPFLAQETTN